MTEMKTLTINGKTYTVADPDAGTASIDDTRVGADAWSGQNTVDKLAPALSESGPVVVCTPVEGYPLGVVSQIAPVQSGSGDPYLPGRGKNLLYHSAKTKTEKGVTFTANADGSITVSGTATDDIFYYATTSFSIGLGEYILSGCPAGGGAASYRMWMHQGSHEGADKYYRDLGDSVTFTVIDSDIPWDLVIAIPANTTVDNLVFQPMLRSSDITDSTYAPYSNIRPITGHTAVKLSVGNENTSQEFTMDLGQTVYGGSLDWRTGVLTVDRAVITASADMKWNQHCIAEDKFQYYSAITDLLFTPNTATVYSDIFKAIPIEDRSAEGNNGSCYAYNGGIAVRYDDIGDIDDWKDFITEYEAQFLYKLATPITVQLTPQEVLALSGTNTLYSDTGDTTVEGRADPRAIIENLRSENTDILNRIAALEAAIVNDI